MKRCAFAVMLTAFGSLLFGHFAVSGTPPSQDEAAQDGIEVLTRGPLHEAFAIPLDVNPRPSPIFSQRPPADIDELPPDQKPEGASIQWIPGYFAWDETNDDYIWISGLWRDTPPGQRWLPGHWVEAAGEADGWQWVAGYWAADDQTDIEYLPPPPPSLDIGPSTEAPDADSFYSPGCWVYRERRYSWRPGFWQRARADWYYSPAYYSWTPAGYIFSEGYWDYPLARRGLLFAPVRFDSRIYGRRGWDYQPRFVIGYQGLFGSLFARGNFGRYYFGDYYAPQFSRQGFVPWFDYRVGRNGPDPLFHHARWQARNEPRWEANLRGLHRDRLSGISPRPPLNWAQQRQLIDDITIRKSFKSGTKTLTVSDPQAVLQHMSVVAPLTKGSHNNFKLLPVAKATQAEHRQDAKRFQAAARDRQTWESKLASDDARPMRPTDPSTKVKVATPKVTRPSKNLVQAPPRPTVPKHVDEPLPKHEDIKPFRVESTKGKGKAPIVGTPKSKERDTPPPKSKERDTPPPKSKERDTPPPKSKERDTPPPKSKERDTPPPKSKERDTPPPKSKEEKKPRKTDDIPSASICPSQGGRLREGRLECCVRATLRDQAVYTEENLIWTL